MSQLNIRDVVVLSPEPLRVVFDAISEHADRGLDGTFSLLWQVGLTEPTCGSRAVCHGQRVVPWPNATIDDVYPDVGLRGQVLQEFI